MVVDFTAAEQRRFWAKVSVPPLDEDGDPDACWPWTGAVTSSGYPSFWWRGRSWSAHRLMIPLSGRRLVGRRFSLHKCDMKRCVRPDHLYPGTQSQNISEWYRRAAERRAIDLEDGNGQKA